MDRDALWATYRHIAKLDELIEDEQGNIWAQTTYGEPRETHNARGTHAAQEAWETAWSDFKPAGELCGTAQCYAGWYAHLKGMEMNGCGHVLVRDGESTRRQEVASWVEEDGGVSCFTYMLGEERTASLFSANNSLERIGEILVQITGEDRR